MVNVLIETDRVELLAGEPQPVDVPRGGSKKQRIFRRRPVRWRSSAATRARASACPEEARSTTLRACHPTSIYTRSKLPWVVLPDDVPAFATYYDVEKLWPAASLERRCTQGDEGLWADDRLPAASGRDAPQPEPRGQVLQLSLDGFGDGGRNLTSWWIALTRSTDALRRRRRRPFRPVGPRGAPGGRSSPSGAAAGLYISSGVLEVEQLLRPTSVVDEPVERREQAVLPSKSAPSAAGRRATRPSRLRPRPARRPRRRRPARAASSCSSALRCPARRAAARLDPARRRRTGTTSAGYTRSAMSPSRSCPTRLAIAISPRIIKNSSIWVTLRLLVHPVEAHGTTHVSGMSRELKRRTSLAALQDVSPEAVVVADPGVGALVTCSSGPPRGAARGRSSVAPARCSNSVRSCSRPRVIVLRRCVEPRRLQATRSALGAIAAVGSIWSR